MGHRAFQLRRPRTGGASGTAVVADGMVFDEPTTVRFPDGQSLELAPGWVRVAWRGRHRSTVLWPNLDSAMAVHGHDGRTQVVWSDGPTGVGGRYGG